MHGKSGKPLDNGVEAMRISKQLLMHIIFKSKRFKMLTSIINPLDLLSEIIRSVKERGPLTAGEKVFCKREVQQKAQEKSVTQVTG